MVYCSKCDFFTTYVEHWLIFTPFFVLFLALGLFLAEATILAVSKTSAFSLISLSQEFVKAGVPDASYYQTLGTLLLAARDWAFMLGPGLVFTLSALILNYI